VLAFKRKWGFDNCRERAKPHGGREQDVGAMQGAFLRLAGTRTSVRDLDPTSDHNSLIFTTVRP
jgi:hypothetical protein